ncbi:ribokinase-like [Teleopsis dalmanni]|uniref:ribokinase-like n=1 Tax=Teleopsis dalmanni TaxID=139649 RepID=UPI0018CE156E|nr:ribokinase-like [Teleopsis dalmanni]
MANDGVENNVEIIIIGNLSIDCISFVPGLPKLGESVRSYKFRADFGGKAGSQCIVAAKLGGCCGFVGNLGTGIWGDKYFKSLEALNVDATFLRINNKRPTGMTQTLISDDEDRVALHVNGANDLLHINTIEDAFAKFNDAKILLCPLDMPKKMMLDTLTSFKAISIVSSASGLHTESSDIIKLASIFICNADQAGRLIAKFDIFTLNDCKVAISKLFEMGAKIAIITMGVLGSVYAKNETPLEYVEVPIRRGVMCRTSYGAFDGFVGALAFFMVRYPDHEMHQHVGAANDVASYTIKCALNEGKFYRAKEIDLNKTIYPYQKYPH